MDDEPILKDEFSWGCRTVQLKLFTFSLQLTGLPCCLNCYKIHHDILLEDIIGTSISNSKNPGCNDGDGRYLHVYWYPRKKVYESDKEMILVCRKIICLRFNGNKEEAATRLKVWDRSVQYYSRGLVRISQDAILSYVHPVHKPILFLVNPKSGKGLAEKLFHQQIEPVLVQAGRPFKLLLTTKPNHAREVIAHQDLSEWGAIVAVSGDGLIHEMINGLFERKDWSSSFKTPFGVIPGGSGNGLARSLAYHRKEVHDRDGVFQNTLAVIRGENKPIDLVCVETKEGPIYSCLSIGFAFMADVDIESECLRFIGDLRFPLWSIIRFTKLRYYRVRLWYLPADNMELQKNGQKKNKKEKNQKNGSVSKRSRLSGLDNNGVQYEEGMGVYRSHDRYYSTCDTNYESTICDDSSLHSYQEMDSETDSNTFCSISETSEFLYSDQSKFKIPDLGVPTLNQPVPSSWVKLEDDFVLLYAVTQSHLTAVYQSLYLVPSDSCISIPLFSPI
ncbi:sphingosine kinase 2 isoform X2 [Eurytemora carolleeae]|uniref:sphingosine kinase 2 isoform X2 n=1 Tax=Eurytemora carolleeae TaxID=1294199 RepID=UPI000C78B242|nr:sphingosine kinase 2 isoform X2 [Eurytemora carolleeae]|eukprot:XP_023324996.1 sphingosine kinase 2-like isoform X2 [Eurytemora affinis]